MLDEICIILHRRDEWNNEGINGNRRRNGEIKRNWKKSERGRQAHIKLCDRSNGESLDGLQLFKLPKIPSGSRIRLQELLLAMAQSIADDVPQNGCSCPWTIAARPFPSHPAVDGSSSGLLMLLLLLPGPSSILLLTAMSVCAVAVRHVCGCRPLLHRCIQSLVGTDRHWLKAVKTLTVLLLELSVRWWRHRGGCHRHRRCADTGPRRRRVVENKARRLCRLYVGVMDAVRRFAAGAFFKSVLCSAIPRRRRLQCQMRGPFHSL